VPQSPSRRTQRTPRAKKQSGARAAWVRPGGELSREETVLREFQSLMNKLTLEMYEPISEKINKAISEADTPSLLKGMIDIIFSKALKEPKFSEIYARLCRQVLSSSRSFPCDDHPITFKRLLLTSCQTEFEKPQAVEDPDNKLSAEERAEAEYKLRMLSLGNSKFIGELYKLGMLPASIMHQCIRRLTIADSEEPPPEENLETLSKLVTTVGKLLEADTRNQYPQDFASYFAQIETLSRDLRISSRIRFMLRDLIDLRRNEWVPRRAAEGPTTIAEVHRTAKQQNIQQAIETQKILSGKLPKRRSDDRDGGPDDGFITVKGGGTPQKPPSLRGLSSPRGKLCGGRPSPSPSKAGGGGGKMRNSRPPRTPLPVAPRGGRGSPAKGVSSPSRSTDASPPRSHGAGGGDAGSGAASAQAGSSSAQPLSDEIAEQKTVILLKEYFLALDAKDSVDNFLELRGEVSSNHIVFLSIIRFHADASSSDKAKTEALLPTLLAAEVFSPADIGYTFDFFFPDIPELVYDTPFLPKYVGTLLGLVLASGVLPAEFLQTNEALTSLIPSRDQAFVLVSSALLALHKANPDNAIVKGFDLAKFIKDGTPDKIQELLVKHKLEALAPLL
ncbi:MAG: hypothetical protein Q8P67_10680, partial [archaeon]|nr:hypothetical protein [archaeon]